MAEIREQCLHIIKLPIRSHQNRIRKWQRDLHHSYLLHNLNFNCSNINTNKSSIYFTNTNSVSIVVKWVDTKSAVLSHLLLAHGTTAKTGWLFCTGVSSLVGIRPQNFGLPNLVTCNWSSSSVNLFNSAVTSHRDRTGHYAGGLFFTSKCTPRTFWRLAVGLCPDPPGSWRFPRLASRAPRKGK